MPDFDTELYLQGDPNTDGSIRLIDGASSLTAEKRTNGLWATKQLGAALSAGSAYLSDPMILWAGDSTVSQNDSLSYQVSASTTTAISRYHKAIGWLDSFTGGALNYDTTIDPSDNLRKGNNAGVGGASILELNTRLTAGDSFTGGAPLSLRPEKYVWVQVGSNDINAGTAIATLISSYTTLLTTIIGAGKIPIATTVLPRNAVDGANDWGATVTTAAQKRLVLNSFNRWMVNYCRDNNLICVNWASVFSNSAGDAITGYTVDGLHPNARGGYYLALEAMRQIGGILPKGRLGSQNAYDVYDATYNPYGNAYNGALSGSVASPNAAFAAGSGTGTVTGTLPTGFQLQKATSTSTNAVASIVTRNGLPAIKIVFTADGAGASSEEWRLNYWTGATTSLASFANYDEILSTGFACEVEAGTLGVLRCVQIRLGTNSGITKTASTISFDAATNTINDSAAGFAFLNNRMVNVAGSASNNRVFKVVSQTASTLTISPTTPVTTEAAGASVTIRLPSQSTAVNASTENFPNENTGVFWVRAPSFVVPNTASITPRMAIFINGTIAGTTTVYVSAPFLGKLPFKPAVLNYTATDT